MPADERLIFVDGCWRAGGGGLADATSPSSGKVFATLSQADGADVDQAVRSAREAATSWARSAFECLVVLASHHGLDTMVNERQSPAGPEQDHPRVTGRVLEALLHRFGNVVLWLNGHRHLNDVQPRPDRSGRTNGFWEVSTAAVADWPCQSRLVEVVASGASEIAVLCTMVDSDVPADPDRAEGRERLAALHRELASINPFSGAGFGREGQRRDRNLALRLPAPFMFS